MSVVLAHGTVGGDLLDGHIGEGGIFEESGGSQRSVFVYKA
jgi:hypothetical protein